MLCVTSRYFLATVIIDVTNSHKSTTVMAGKSELNSADLYKELQGAINDDKKYWIRNDAKLRAVMTAKTYDEFREIVAAAHLQPLTRNDISKRKQNSWNHLAKEQSNYE